MSNKRKNTRTARPAAPNAATDTAPEDGQGAPARTSAEAKLRAALHAHPGSTTAQLASHAGIGASTAGKTLSRWLSDGHVSRAPGAVDNDGGGKRRSAGTWTTAAPGTDTAPPDADPATPASGPSTAAGTEADAAVPADAPAAPATARRSKKQQTSKNDSAGKLAHNTNGGPKLRSGELRGQVEDELRDHPTSERSPVEIANKLGRSSGAVANALDKLTDDGVAVRTSDKPKRYRLAADATDG